MTVHTSCTSRTRNTKFCVGLQGRFIDTGIDSYNCYSSCGGFYVVGAIDRRSKTENRFVLCIERRSYHESCLSSPVAAGLLSGGDSSLSERHRFPHKLACLFERFEALGVTRQQPQHNTRRIFFGDAFNEVAALADSRLQRHSR